MAAGGRIGHDQMRIDLLAFHFKGVDVALILRPVDRSAGIEHSAGWLLLHDTFL